VVKIKLDNKMSLGKKVFIQSRPSGGNLYQWSPPPNNTSGNSNVKKGGVGNYFCTATPYSQGEDWITRYTYSVVVIDSIVRREAYVQCDYVE
jgi:hypothetical protein